MTTSTDTLRGATLAERYRLDDVLGRGAFGVVWRGRDLQLARDVAVKTLAPEGLDGQARERLLHEAKAVAALEHPNVVRVYDAGEDRGVPFVVFELVTGGTLRARPPADVPTAITITRQILSALGAAHARGIVHRDVKPENVLVSGPDDAPVARLADFGIARAANASRLTASGTIVGTAAYLSPEASLGLEVDARTDLYSTGVVLYEMVAGRPPFDGPDALAVISQHLHAPLVPARTYRPDVPPELDGVLARLLAKDRDARFPGAAEALAALDAVPVGGAAAAPADEGAGGLSLSLLVRGRLVGRASELERLRELWRQAMRGHAQLALVSGEPGVGKTRLAHELIVAARLDGATVLSGGCYEYEATTPYLPFVEALRAWARGRDANAMKAALGDAAQELARLAPEIETRIGPLPPSPALEPHEERLRLFDAFARFLRALATDGGVVMFVDDLQWADQGSLALAHYVLRHLRESPFLLLATYREVELDRAHPLAAALVEWDRDRLATRVQLGRLGRAGTDALLATLMGQDTVSDAFGEAIHKETEGNPFFVEEVVKALIEQGQIYRRDGEWHRGEMHELAIPQSVKAAIGRRLDKLPKACVDVLHEAAALGKTFELDDLVAGSGGSEAEVLDALDQAFTAQLVAERDGGRIAFTHDKIREVLYEELNPVRRRRLHQRLGEAIEKRGGGRPEGRAEDLAHHFLHSGDAARGYEYSLRAAERAWKVVALDVALDYLEKARECAETLRDDDKLAHVDRRLADTHRARGDAPHALAVYRRLLERETDHARRAELRVEMGEMMARYGEAGALETLEQAVGELDRERQPRAYALAVTSMGRVYHYRREHRRSLALYEEALPFVESSDDASLIMALYGYLAGAYQHLGDFEQSDAWSRRSIEAGRRLASPLLEALGHEFLSENASARGWFRESAEHGEADERIGERVGSLERTAWGRWTRSLALVGMGRLEEGLALARNARELARQIGENRLELFTAASIAFALADQGEFDEASAVAREGVERAARIGQPTILAFMHRVEGYVLFRRGNAAKAWEVLSEGIRLQEGSENNVNRPASMALAAEIALALERTDEAERYAALAIEFGDARGFKTFSAEARRVLARIAAAGGDRDGALALLERALADQQSSPAPIEEARTRLVRATILEAAGRGDEAKQDRAAALEHFRRCGARPEAERLEREGR